MCVYELFGGKATPTKNPILNGVKDKKVNYWEKNLETEIGFSNHLAGFLNSSIGISIGFNGETHYTLNGGKTWPRSINRSYCRYGLEIFNEKTSWSCGNGAMEGHSTDGGKIWRPMASFGLNLPEQCHYLSFVSQTTGWIASLQQLDITTDGGDHWTDLKLPKGIKKITAIALNQTDPTARNGYLLDDSGSGTLFITKNGGKSWTTRPIGFKGDQISIQFFTPIAAMRFFDSEQGVIIINRSGGTMWALRTVDGGQTWHQEQMPSTFGKVFLSRDGKTLTTSYNNKIQMFQWKENTTELYITSNDFYTRPLAIV